MGWRHYSDMAFQPQPWPLPVGIAFSSGMAAKACLSAAFGPIRAVIPLAAGVMLMPRARFWFANVTLALVWAPMLLFAGDLIGLAGARLVGAADIVLLTFIGIALFGIAGALWAALRAGRPKASVVSADWGRAFRHAQCPAQGSSLAGKRRGGASCGAGTGHEVNGFAG